MQALEFMIFLVMFYLITQLLVPAILPKYLEFNWVFKSNKGKGKVDSLLNKKKNLIKEIDKTLAQLEEEAKKAEEAKKLAEQKLK